jgi:two-component system, LuxR family, sensor kinase FixL
VPQHLARNIREVLPELADALEPLYRRALETRRPLVGQEIRGTRDAAAGRDSYWLINCSPVVGSDGEVTGVCAVVQDITDRKHAEVQREERARRRAIVESLGHLALTTNCVQTLMDDAAREIRDALSVNFVEVLELDAEGRSLLLRAGAGWPAGMVRHPDRGARPDLQEGLTLTAQEPIVSSDLQEDKRFTTAPALLEHGARSGVTVVIPGHPSPVGVLGAFATDRREFSDDDVNLLRAIARVLGAAIKEGRSAQALSDAAARVDAIVMTLVDGIITIDDRGVLDSVNPAAERLFGYAAHELLGKNVSVLMPQPYRREHDGYIADYLRTGEAKIIGIGREVVGQRKDGTVFPIELAVSQMRVGGRLMFTGIVRDVTERRRLEREILQATAEEQRRIGQDLHDGVLQELAGVAFAVEVLTQKLAARGAPEAASIRKIADLVDQSITHARDLARGLQPVALEGAGLAVALEALATKVEGLFRISCFFTCDEPCLIHDNALATHLYRIAQEAITNAVRHGKARTVVIDLARGPEGLRLVIRDDGIGLHNAPSDAHGVGLHTMAYRAALVGGRLTVSPGERGGAVIACVIPRPVLERDSTKEDDHGQETTRQRQVQGQNPTRRRPPHRPGTAG